MPTITNYDVTSRDNCLGAPLHTASLSGSDFAISPWRAHLPGVSYYFISFCHRQLDDDDIHERLFFLLSLAAFGLGCRTEI
jgi:hypothetical protein